jgi:hypothetical protein
MRKFVDGYEVTVDGLQFRVQRGRKGRQDLILQWLTPTRGWQTISMTAVALLVEFLHENEGRLYPFGRGGEMVMDFLRDAVTNGWARIRPRDYHA